MAYFVDQNLIINTDHTGDTAMGVLDQYWCGIVDTNNYAGNHWKALAAWVYDIEEDEIDERDDACLAPTPGWWNDGLGNEWPDAAWGTQEALAAYRAAVARLLPTKEPQEQPNRFPAYRSIAFRFADKPAADEWTAWQQRVRDFPGFATDSGWTITGMRLVRRVLAEVEESAPWVVG